MDYLVGETLVRKTSDVGKKLEPTEPQVNVGWLTPYTRRLTEGWIRYLRIWKILRQNLTSKTTVNRSTSPWGGKWHEPSSGRSVHPSSVRPLLRTGRIPVSTLTPSVASQVGPALESIEVDTGRSFTLLTSLRFVLLLTGGSDPLGVSVISIIL